MKTILASGMLMLLTSAMWSLPSTAKDSIQGQHPDNRPNILLIVADDLGYADLGSFGSDIKTPNLDALANAGVRFNNFHTAVKCAPTRAMLLSGNNSHVAGMASQGVRGILGEAYPGYEAALSDRIIAFPRLLREAGYHTYMTGKWHLGSGDNQGPQAAGFERSFVLLHGAGNHWDAKGFFEGGSKYRADGQEASWPEGGYSTDVYTGKLIDFMASNRDDGKPFFAFAAYTSPHWPLQVPEAELDRYKGRYDRGYDSLREKNFARLKAAGIVTPDAQLPPRNEGITPWEQLTDEQKQREARKMELYAAMVSNLDHHVGRLLEYLKESGQFENTLLVFMSDNGAAAEDFYNGDRYPEFREYLRKHYDNSFDNMGRPDSWVSYDAPWAEAGSAPFSRYKTFTREGGVTAPMIIAGPGVAGAGSIRSDYLTVMDLAPTFLELAGASYPEAEGTRPMLGESLVSALGNPEVAAHDDDYLTIHSHRGRMLLRQGDWKLTNLEPPFDEEKLELFNLATDPGETLNLRESEPQKFAELLELWRNERKALGIVLPEDL
jgi:arylsulfatase A-like enzyme